MCNLKCGIIGCNYNAVVVRNGVSLCAFHNEIEVMEYMEQQQQQQQQNNQPKPQKK